MVANIFGQVCLLLAFMLPIVDIVDRMFLLESLQHCRVFFSDSLRLFVSDCYVEGLCNCLFTSGNRIFTGIGLSWRLFLYSVGWDWRHVTFLMLREVGAGSGENLGHAFE